MPNLKELLAKVGDELRWFMATVVSVQARTATLSIHGVDVANVPFLLGRTPIAGEKVHCLGQVGRGIVILGSTGVPSGVQITAPQVVGFAMLAPSEASTTTTAVVDPNATSGVFESTHVSTSSTSRRQSLGLDSPELTVDELVRGGRDSAFAYSSHWNFADLAEKIREILASNAVITTLTFTLTQKSGSLTPVLCLTPASSSLVIGADEKLVFKVARLKTGIETQVSVPVGWIPMLANGEWLISTSAGVNVPFTTMNSAATITLGYERV